VGFDNGWVDESANPKTLSRTGSVSLVPASSIGFGTQRAFFDGTGSFIDIVHTGTDFDLGTGDFTCFVEFELPSSATDKLVMTLCSPPSSASALRISVVGTKIRVKSSSNGTTWAIDLTSTLDVVPDTPTTLKIARNGNSWYLYLNTQLSDTWVSSISLLPNAAGYIHRIGSGNSLNFLSGFIDELVLVKGIALLSGATTIVDRVNKWPRVPHTPGCSSGNVPTLAALGSNTVTGLISGATGELLRVFDRDGFLDLPVVLAAGTPMPATGFIKLRTKTGNFIPGETISLPGGATIVATDAGKRSWINVVGKEASVITVAKSTECRFLGDWYLVGTTDGGVNQTLQFPIADVCPGLYIETGPGTNQYEWWFCGGGRWGTTTQFIPTDTRGKYFGSDPLTGLITFAKRSTSINCGYLPPAGCRVYVGNVFLSNASAGYYSLNTQPTSSANKFFVSTTANGSLVKDKVSCGWRCDFATPYSLLVKDSGILHSLIVTNCIQKPKIQNVCIGLHGTFDTAAIELKSNTLGAEVLMVYATRYKGNVSSTWTLNLSDNSGTSVVDGGVYHIFGNTTDAARGNSAVYALLVTRTSDVIIDNVKVAGSYVYFSAASNIRMNNIQYADLIMGETTTVVPITAIALYNASDITCLGFSNYDNIPNVHPYSGIAQAYNTSTKFTLGNIGTKENPYNGGSAGGIMGFILITSNSDKIVLKRIYISNHRSALLITSTSNNKIEVRDVWGRTDITQGINSSNTVVKNCKWARSTSGQSSSYGRHFEEFSIGFSYKHINVIFNEPSAETLNRVSLYGYGQEIAYPRLSRFLQTGTGVLSENQLTISGASIVRANTSITAGSLNKWDWEVTVVDVVDMATIGIGRSFTGIIGWVGEGVAYLSNGQKMTDSTYFDYGEPYGVGDVIGVAVDMENNTVEFFKNGISQGIALTGLTGVFHPAVGRTVYNATYTVNFGQNPRAYPVKPGFTKDYGNPPGFFTGAGSLTMENLSDEIILEMDYFMIGVTAMTALEPTFTGTNPSNHYVDFQYDIGSGYNGTWLQAVSSSFSLVPSINPAVGIKIKLRIVPSVASVANLITYYMLNFDSSEALQSIQYPEPVTLIDGMVSGLVSGSRLKILNKTTDTPIYNQVVAGTSVTISYQEGVDFTTGDLIEIKATGFSGATAKLPFKTSTQAQADGWSVFIEQEDDVIYSQIAIDGSTVDEFVMDTVNNYIKINKPDKATTVQRLYAWTAYYRNTEFGIANLFDTFEAIDALNFRRNPAEYAWFLYNELLTSVRLFGAYMYSTDDSFFIADSEAGVSGSIFMDSKRAYGVDVPTSGLTTEESALLSEVSTLAKETSVQAAIRAAKAAQAFSLL